MPEQRLITEVSRSHSTCEVMETLQREGLNLLKGGSHQESRAAEEKKKKKNSGAEK